MCIKQYSNGEQFVGLKRMAKNNERGAAWFMMGNVVGPGAQSGSEDVAKHSDIWRKKQNETQPPGKSWVHQK